MYEVARNLVAFTIWSLLYIVPVGAGMFLIALLAGKRIAFSVVDWSLLILPWVTWFGVASINSSHKSLANLAEVYAVAAVAVISFGLRCFLTPRVSQHLLSKTAVLVTCLFAAALALLVPSLPE